MIGPLRGWTRRHGLVVLMLAAFGLIAAVVAAPLVERLWSPPVAVSETLEPVNPGETAPSDSKPIVREGSG